MDNQVTDTGYHGTSASKAESIKNFGFTVSSGKYGCGAYFWEDSIYANYLAQGWWAYCHNDLNAYQGDADKRCTVICVHLQTKESEFLDLENREVKAGFASLCSQRGIKFRCNQRKIAETVNLFVTRLERKLSIKIKILRTTTSPPPEQHVTRYPMFAIGGPVCLVVFDPACISIINTSFPC